LVGEKKELLSYLAARKFEQEQYALFEQGELQGYIAEHLGISTEDSEAVLDAVEAQHGLLIERAQGFWSFSHLTFQEYFTAKWFCDRADWAGLAAQVGKKHWREVFLLTVEMLQNPDFLLQLMKQKVDALLADDEILQRFLIWINEKSMSVNATYKPVALRFFYLSLSLDIHYPTGRFNGFGWVPLVPPPMRNLDHNFDKIVDPDMALDFTFKLIHDIDQSYRTAFAEFHKEEIAESAAESAALKHADTIYYALRREFKPELKTAIEPLKEQLPYSLLEVNKFMGWWQANGQAWTEKLREVLIKYHKFHDFNFNDTQKHCIKQYYDANKLLVDCLKSCCELSDDDKVRKKIEEKLLLPFDVIENSQQQM
jgi:predicted NACHT family NTPase